MSLRNLKESEATKLSPSIHAWISTALLSASLADALSFSALQLGSEALNATYLAEKSKGLHCYMFGTQAKWIFKTPKEQNYNRIMYIYIYIYSIIFPYLLRSFFIAVKAETRLRVTQLQETSRQLDDIQVTIAASTASIRMTQYFSVPD